MFALLDKKFKRAGVALFACHWFPMSGMQYLPNGIQRLLSIKESGVSLEGDRGHPPTPSPSTCLQGGYYHPTY